MSTHSGAAPALVVAPNRSTVQLAFAVIYIVWGVSYAVNRIMALQLPPCLAAGARFALAGSLLMVVARTRGLSLPNRSGDWLAVCAAAVLGVVVSNGLSVLALRHIASNQAALIGSSSAFWIAWFGMYGRRPSPVSKRTWVGLALGFVGVAVLLSAHGFGANAHLGWQLAVVASTLCWALATAIIREADAECSPLAFTACYLLLGGALMAGVGLVSGDAGRWVWSLSGLAAMVFLATFSSTFGFVAYTYLLRHEAPSRIGTYAYVNPIVAVFTGWLLLNERLDAMQLVGSLIVFAGVILVRNLRLFPRLARATRPAARNAVRSA